MSSHELRKEIVDRVACRACGEAVVEVGDAIQQWPSDRYREMPVCRPYEVVLDGALVVVARCKCGTQTVVSHAARVWRMVRWHHKCSECSEGHDSLREQVVVMYRGLK